MTDAQRGHPMLAELFRHNLWANLTLIDLCATLPDEILETNVPGTYRRHPRDARPPGRARRSATLSAYRSGGFQSDESNPYPGRDAAPRSSLTPCASTRVKSGEGFIAYAETVEGNPTLQVTWHDQSYEMPAALFLVQAINHATEHRTQIKTALTQAGITPPELDGWTWDDARREQTQ